MTETIDLDLEKIEDFHRQVRVDKSNKLDAITNFVRSNGEADPNTRVEIEDKGGNIQVITSNGLVLNDFLPQNYRFKEGGSKYFWANGITKTIEVPTDFRSTETNKQQLAHEFGHVLDPDFEDLSLEIMNQREQVVDTSEESLEHAVNMVNMSLTLEIQAHNYGRVVAQALGVDMVRYEDRITRQLQEHSAYNLEKLATAVDWEEDGIREKQITLIDPVTQEEVPTTLGEVESIIFESLEE